ncbi:TPA: antitermination protein [Enterobacter asburiae]|nr:antitermination protein [Enterobacter kobei]HCH0655759.1 antitermination protein [Enterobacter asburiae]
MNAQQMEYVRIQLRAALIDDSGGTKGQLEAFAEHQPADKNRNPRQHMHVVELDNGCGGVRRVKAENSALYVMETRSRRRPMPLIRDKAFSLCAWRRAVLKLDVSQQAWVRFCYGFELHFDHQIEICSFIWSIFEMKTRGQKIQQKVKKRLISMVWLAVQDSVTGLKNSAYTEYAASTLASLLQMERSTWSRVYAKHWHLLKCLVTELDATALCQVATYFEQASKQRS